MPLPYEYIYEAELEAKGWARLRLKQGAPRNQSQVLFSPPTNFIIKLSYQPIAPSPNRNPNRDRDPTPETYP